MRHLLTVILTISFSVSHGQDFAYPEIKSTGGTIADFIPIDWSILDSVSGDLNKDGLVDVAIILQRKDSILLINDLEDMALTKPRILLVLFRTSVDNSFTLIEQSNSFILKHNNSAMNDPYHELAIKNGILEIKFHLFYNMGSWYVTDADYKFRYQGGQLVLIGADYLSFHRATHDYDEYSYNFLTKKRSFTKGNDNRGTKRTTWKSINISSLKTLKTFNKPFTWEVEKDIYL